MAADRTCTAEVRGGGDRLIGMRSDSAAKPERDAGRTPPDVTRADPATLLLS